MSKILDKFTEFRQNYYIPVKDDTQYVCIYIHIYTKTYQFKNLENVSLFKNESLDNIHKMYILL